MLQRKAAFFLKLVLFINLALTLFLAQPIAPVYADAVSSLPLAIEGQTLRIDGSNEMAAINQLLTQQFEQQFPQAEVELNTSNTEAALEKLLNGDIDLAAIGRPLTDGEKAQGLLEIPISREKIAIIVGQDNPFRGDLTVEHLNKIFRGEITNWSEVGGVDAAIRVIDRPALSDTRLALQKYQMFQDPQPLAGTNRVQLQQDDTAAVIRELGTDGISYAIASQLAAQDKARIIKLVVTLGVLPEDRLYPYTQLRGYAYKAPNDVTQAFLGVAVDKPGQAAIAAAKLTEAKAVAAGKPIVESQPIVAPKILEAPETPVSLIPDSPIAKEQDDRFKFIWILLPLVPLILLLLWLRQRRSRPTKTSTNLEAPEPPSSPTLNKSETDALPTKPIEANIETELIEEFTVDTNTELTEPIEESEEEVVEEIEASEENIVGAEPIAPELIADDELVAEIVYVAEEQTVNEADNLAIAEAVIKQAIIVEEAPEGTIEETIEEITSDTVEEIIEESTEAAGSIEEEVITPELIDTPIEETTLEIISAELVIEETKNTTEPIIRSIDESITEPIDKFRDKPTNEADQLVSEVLTESVLESEPELTEASATELNPPEINLSEAEPEAEILDEATNLTPEMGEAQPLLSAKELIPPSVLTPALDKNVFTLKQIFLDALRHQGKEIEAATPLECYAALSAALCNHLLSLKTPETYLTQDNVRIIGEISAEYMPGPHLENSLINLGLLEEARQMTQELGLDLKQLIDQEQEPGLGRGELGRLMICCLDSLSTANVPAIGYGIRYEYGIFNQDLQDGWQVELTDTWLRNGNPWEVEHSEKAVEVKFGGSTEAYMDEQGHYRVRWLANETIQGIPYDTPIPGYHSETVNFLRLWRAANDSNLCKVLDSADVESQSKELRLKQQYFLVACALQDALRLHCQTDSQPNTLPDRFALQLNNADTALAIAELMRLLVDEYNTDWETAWQTTQQIFSYTDHSLISETLDELWTVEIFGHFLPRHLEIIYEINYRFLEIVKAKYPGDDARLNQVSLIDERGERYIRSNYLAYVGSHAVNGISQLHTQSLQQIIFPSLYEMYPERFSNKTNGVTPRRFLLQGNPALAALITSKIGNGWITNLEELRALEAHVNDPDFCDAWRQIKQAAKQRLAIQIRQQTGIEVAPNSLFDIQAMEIHEYKRQHLNVLHILTLYHRIKANPQLNITPRTFIFAGKAAPDYFTAKLIIKLINAVATVINRDPDVQGRLKVVFLKDFNIKTAQMIYPAADLAEYISVAGSEAADTGSMIFAMNGGRIIGTPNGSNIELCHEIGAENCFQFGLTTSEVLERRGQSYNRMQLYHANSELKAAIDSLTSGIFANGDTERFRPLANLLLYCDQYMVLADYASYLECQAQVDQAYRSINQWTRKSILTAARMGKFSSDRAVREYCEEIWFTPINLSLEYAQAKKSLG